MLTVHMNVKLSVDQSIRGLCDLPYYIEQLIIFLDEKVFCQIIVKYVNRETEEELWFP